jgi:hypothetical protein
MDLVKRHNYTHSDLPMSVARQKYGHNDLPVGIWAFQCVARWKYRHRDLSNVCAKVQIWAQASASVCSKAEMWTRKLPTHVVR